MDNKSFEDWMQEIIGGFDKIDKTLDRMNKLKECFNGDTLLDNHDLCQLLGVTKRTIAGIGKRNCFLIIFMMMGGVTI